ncbi:MAG: hypothetical protein FWE97_02925 [Dehalococcoidia bacterium]|nr:hypothetical protein [Dehalococcoidia bacterium]
MGGAIDYQKVMSEIVFVNLPGPVEPTAGMSGGELMHGFLADVYNAPPEVKAYVEQLCLKWNIHYRQNK